MDDAFALLDLPRQAAMNEDEIQERHHARIADVHPDKAANDEERDEFSKQTSDLNLAAQLLKNPVTRLRHLLDLLAPGEKHDAGLDPDLMELFAKVGGAVQNARNRVTIAVKG
ncbi:MAG: hypothetical protein AAF585_06490, partial [Verrucomicrobiota bacterium]